MQPVWIKAIIAMLWVSAVSILGSAENVNSFSRWTVFTGIAILPPLVMVFRWKNPPQTMSQAIQEVLR